MSICVIILALYIQNLNDTASLTVETQNPNISAVAETGINSNEKVAQNRTGHYSGADAALK